MTNYNHCIVRLFQKEFYNFDCLCPWLLSVEAEATLQHDSLHNVIKDVSLQRMYPELINKYSLND